MSINPLLPDILCCPDCGGDLDLKAHSITCKKCLRSYEKTYAKEKVIPVLFSSNSDFVFSPKKDAYGLPQKHTLLSRLAQILWPPEPACFYGDLQRKFDIKNYHQDLKNFIQFKLHTTPKLFLLQMFS